MKIKYVKINDLHDRLMRLKNVIGELNVTPSVSCELEATINKLFPECFSEDDNETQTTD